MCDSSRLYEERNYEVDRNIWSTSMKLVGQARIYTIHPLSQYLHPCMDADEIYARYSATIHFDWLFVNFLHSPKPSDLISKVVIFSLTSNVDRMVIKL